MNILCAIYYVLMSTWVCVCVNCVLPPTCAALDGSDGGGGARGWIGPPVAHHSASLLLLLRAAFLYGTHIAVAPHAEAAGHGQVQGIHRLRLHLTEHWLTHCLDLPVHLHLTHLRMRGHTKTHTVHAHNHTDKKHTQKRTQPCTGGNNNEK